MFVLRNWEQGSLFITTCCFCSGCSRDCLYQRRPAVHPVAQATHGTLGSTERSPNQWIPEFCGGSCTVENDWQVGYPKPVSRLTITTPINIRPTSGQLLGNRSWRSHHREVRWTIQYHHQSHSLSSLPCVVKNVSVCIYVWFSDLVCQYHCRKYLLVTFIIIICSIRISLSYCYFNQSLLVTEIMECSPLHGTV